MYRIFYDKHRFTWRGPPLRVLLKLLLPLQPLRMDCDELFYMTNTQLVPQISCALCWFVFGFNFHRNVAIYLSRTCYLFTLWASSLDKPRLPPVGDLTFSIWVWANPHLISKMYMPRSMETHWFGSLDRVLFLNALMFFWGASVTSIWTHHFSVRHAQLQDLSQNPSKGFERYSDREGCLPTLTTSSGLLSPRLISIFCFSIPLVPSADGAPMLKSWHFVFKLLNLLRWSQKKARWLMPDEMLSVIGWPTSKEIADMAGIKPRSFASRSDNMKADPR